MYVCVDKLLYTNELGSNTPTTNVIAQVAELSADVDLYNHCYLVQDGKPKETELSDRLNNIVRSQYYPNEYLTQIL